MSGDARDTDLDIPPALDRRGKRDFDDGYDGQDDAKRSYDVAVQEMRRDYIGERPVLSIPGEVEATGLALPEDLTFDEWLDAGKQLQAAERSLMWWIGDWLRYGEQKWGEKYAQAIESTGKGYQALRNAKWVAEQYADLSTRVDKLSWSHHREAAALPEPERSRILHLADDNGWSARELKQRVNQAKNTAKITSTEPDDGTCKVSDLWALAERGVQFGTIYADPPWKYDNQGTRASTGNHYDGMTVDELCALPIDQLASDDAHLHIWTTNAFLFECPKIFEAWGFEFRSSFIWVKPQIGIGNYWRNSHEFLLTAIRGNAKSFSDKTLKSWLQCDRAAHSAKPEQVRSFIERASPGPYLELFGRRVADGWAVWGNQIEQSIFEHSVKEVA